MPVLVTRGMIATLRHLYGGALDETYTRIPLVGVLDAGGVPLLDDWGHQVTEAGPPRPGLACKLRVAETVARDDRGAVLVRRPMLTIRHDDDARPGDLAVDVRDGEGRLLLAQSAVLRVEPSPTGPGSVTVVVELEGAEALPLPPGAS